MRMTPRAEELGLLGCHACGLVCEATASPARCPRCHAHLHARKPAGVERTAAYLLASLILYIPANLLPVMHTSSFGSGSDSTILNGVIEFWHAGAWDIALIIFIASVAVPCTKFLVLGLLLWTVRRHSIHGRRQRPRLYRFVELIGYWSMLDVLVVALVAALVQFHALSSVEPRAGILFFGLVVILTMLSAMSFDPRLIWDSKESKENNEP